MKLLWFIAGMTLLGVITGAFIFSGMRQSATEKETSAFVTGTVDAISDCWHVRAFTNRAEPGLVAAMALQGQSASDLFAVYRRLGQLVSEPHCQIKDMTQFGTENQYLTASYGCTADYAYGSATIKITVRRKKDSEEWKIYYFNIASPLFDKPQ